MRDRDGREGSTATPARAPVARPPGPTDPARGRALEGPIAARMGRALGHDFADVRIFDDAEAAREVSRERAIATTVGRDISFAPGAYHPGTLAGDALLAHELAHVQQQADGALGGVADHGALEADATGAAIGAMADLRGVPLPGAPRGAVRRAPRGVQRCGGAPSWAPAMPQGALTPPAGATPGLLSGEQVDQMITASPTIGPYVRGRVNPSGACSGSPVRAAGHTHYVDDAQMRDAYTNYLGRSLHPAHMTGCGARTYNETEARAAPIPDGFRDGQEAYVRLVAAPAAPLHEGIHRLQNDAIAFELGLAAMEGTTEYFTRKVLTEAGSPVRASNVYGDQHEAIRHMVEDGGVGTAPLCEAYFEASFASLRAAMDRGQAGRYDAWQAAMNRQNPDYAAANALF